jgi:hypothetical protein
MRNNKRVNVEERFQKFIDANSETTRATGKKVNLHTKRFQRTVNQRKLKHVLAEFSASATLLTYIVLLPVSRDVKRFYLVTCYNVQILHEEIFIFTISSLNE